MNLIKFYKGVIMAVHRIILRHNDLFDYKLKFLKFWLN
jgi:hypothetical protein